MQTPTEDGPCVITPGCPGQMHATPHHDRIDWRCNGCACTTCDQIKVDPVEEVSPGLTVLPDGAKVAPAPSKKNKLA